MACCFYKVTIANCKYFWIKKKLVLTLNLALKKFSHSIFVWVKIMEWNMDHQKVLKTKNNDKWLCGSSFKFFFFIFLRPFTACWKSLDHFGNLFDSLIFLGSVTFSPTKINLIYNSKLHSPAWDSKPYAPHLRPPYLVEPTTESAVNEWTSWTARRTRYDNNIMGEVLIMASIITLELLSENQWLLSRCQI